MKKIKFILYLAVVLVSLNGCKKVNPLKSDVSKEKSDYFYQEQKFKDRIMGFTKLSLSDRKKIIESITFTKGIPNGINGTANLLDKLSKKDLLSFFETFFDSNSVAVMDGSSNMDRIIVQSKTNMEEKNRIPKTNTPSTEWALNCWVTIKGAKNSSDPLERCISSYPNDACIYYNYNAPGCN